MQRTGAQTVVALTPAQIQELQRLLTRHPTLHQLHRDLRRPLLRHGGHRALEQPVDALLEDLQPAAELAARPELAVINKAAAESVNLFPESIVIRENYNEFAKIFSIIKRPAK